MVRDIETDMALVECFGSGAGACRIERACALRGVLAEAMEAFLAVLTVTRWPTSWHPRRRWRPSSAATGRRRKGGAGITGARGA